MAISVKSKEKSGLPPTGIIEQPPLAVVTLWSLLVLRRAETPVVGNLAKPVNPTTIAPSVMIVDGI